MKFHARRATRQQGMTFRESSNENDLFSKKHRTPRSMEQQHTTYLGQTSTKPPAIFEHLSCKHEYYHDGDRFHDGSSWHLDFGICLLVVDDIHMLT